MASNDFLEQRDYFGAYRNLGLLPDFYDSEIQQFLDNPDASPAISQESIKTFIDRQVSEKTRDFSVAAAFRSKLFRLRDQHASFDDIQLICSNYSTLSSAGQRWMYEIESWINATGFAEQEKVEACATLAEIAEKRKLEKRCVLEGGTPYDIPILRQAAPVEGVLSWMRSHCGNGGIWHSPDSLVRLAYVLAHRLLDAHNSDIFNSGEFKELWARFMHLTSSSGRRFVEDLSVIVPGWWSDDFNEGQIYAPLLMAPYVDLITVESFPPQERQLQDGDQAHAESFTCRFFSVVGTQHRGADFLLPLLVSYDSNDSPRRIASCLRKLACHYIFLAFGLDRWQRATGLPPLPISVIDPVEVPISYPGFVSRNPDYLSRYYWPTGSINYDAWCVAKIIEAVTRGETLSQDTLYHLERSLERLWTWYSNKSIS